MLVRAWRAVTRIEQDMLLGDSHNFGQCVKLASDGRIFKPRCLSWEWLFLNGQSPVRSYFSCAAERYEFANPCDLFPDLNFSSDKFEELTNGGYVEVLTIEKNPHFQLSKHQYEKIGSAIALMTWFGISDLHAKNIFFGLMHSEQLIFCPIDIECIFDNFTLPTQTHLVPSDILASQYSGLETLSQHMNMYGDANCIAALCDGYLRAMQFFSERAPDIYEIVKNIEGINNVPVRVILKRTREYLDEMNCDFEVLRCSGDYIDSEIEQMARNDVPYYYRTITSNQLYYFVSQKDVKRTQLPEHIRAKVFSNTVTDDGSSAFFTRSYDALLKGGVLQLAKYFGRSIQNACGRTPALKLNYRQDRISIKSSRLAIACKR